MKKLIDVSIISLSLILLVALFSEANSTFAQCVNITSYQTSVCKGTPFVVGGTTSSSYLNAQVRVYIATSACGTDIIGNSVCSINGSWSNASISTSTLTPGTYYLNAYIPASTGACGYTGSGCACPVSKQVTVLPVCTAPTSASANPTTICSGQSSILTVTPSSPGSGCTWKWYSGGCGNGSSIGSGTSITVSPTSSTTYYVRSEGSCGPTSCVSVTVTVQSACTSPSSAYASPSTICAGYSSTLTVSPSSPGTNCTWKWYAGGCGSGSSVGSGTSITVYPSSTTTYYVRSEGSCGPSGCVTATVTVNQNTCVSPINASANPSTINLGQSSTLTVTPTSPGSNCTWQWYAGSCGTGTYVGSGNTISVSPSSTTTYYVRSEGSCGNSTCVSTTVTVNIPCTTPTTQASNITFNEIQTYQMTVNWTNGNGSSRIVKINTSNSFTNPVDGNTYSANTVYGGGEQTIYNNSGSSVTVTNLTANTNYWFRVYEYNCTGSSTKYNTSIETNNPNSQATSNYTNCVLNNLYIQNENNYRYSVNLPSFTGDPLYNNEDFIIIPHSVDFIYIIVEIAPPIGCSHCNFSGHLINSYNYYNSPSEEKIIFSFNYDDITIPTIINMGPIMTSELFDYGQIFLDNYEDIKFTLAKNKLSGENLKICINELISDPLQSNFLECLIYTGSNFIPFISTAADAHSTICDIRDIEKNPNSDNLTKLIAELNLGLDIFGFALDKAQIVGCVIIGGTTCLIVIADDETGFGIVDDIICVTTLSAECYSLTKAIQISLDLLGCALKWIDFFFDNNKNGNIDEDAKNFIYHISDLNNESRSLLNGILNNNYSIGISTVNFLGPPSSDTICPVLTNVTYHGRHLYFQEDTLYNEMIPGVIKRFYGINAIITSTDDSTVYNYTWTDTADVRIRISNNYDSIQHDIEQYTINLGTGNIINAWYCFADTFHQMHIDINNDFIEDTFVYPDAVEPIVISNVEYCLNASPIPLIAVGNDLLWYTTPSGGIGSTITPIPNTTVSGITIYYVSQTINGIESPRASIEVIVHTIPNADAGTDTTICAGQSITLVATGGVAYEWNYGVINGEPFVPDSSRTYTVIVTDNKGCTATDSVTVTVLNSYNVEVKAYLEGPFLIDHMLTDLNENGLIQLSQPYNTEPWNYNGTEAVESIPNENIVDWVLVELRDAEEASSASPQTRISSKAGFITKDGYIVDLDGTSNLNFGELTISHNLYAIVWHRNHLGILSANPLSTNNGCLYTYDFTTGSEQVYGGLTGYSQINEITFGMSSGDANSDGRINNDDKTEVWQIQAGNSFYLSGDLNFDSQVDNKDKNDHLLKNQGKYSRIPGEIPTNGLIAFYPLDGNANDASGSGNDGIEHEIAYTVSRFGVSEAAGLISGNEGTNGSCKYFEIPNIIDGLESFTISMWIDEDYMSYEHGNFYISFGEYFGLGHILHTQTSEDWLCAAVRTEQTGIVENGVLFETNWLEGYQHYILTFDGALGTASVYHNNGLVLNETFAPGIAYAPGEGAGLGWGSFSGCCTRFNGSVDDVRIYNRVLNTTEMESLYNEGGWTPTLNHLVAYFPFNGNTRDESGYGNHGNAIGPQLCDDRFGNQLSAYNFNGIADYIDVPNSESIGLYGDLNSEITLCAWVNTEASPLKQGIVGRWGGTAGIRYLLFVLENGCGDIHTTTIGTPYAGGSVITINSWHYIVGTYSSVTDSLKLYVDGLLEKNAISSNPFGTDPDSPKNLEIGRFDNNYYFKGWIDDIRIYNKALNESEIQELYHEGGWPIINDDPIAYYPFNGNANDESGHGNNGVADGAVWTADRFGNANSAYYFDGQDDLITVPNGNSLSITGDITLSAWVFDNGISSSDYHTIINKRVLST